MRMAPLIAARYTEATSRASRSVLPLQIAATSMRHVWRRTPSRCRSGLSSVPGETSTTAGSFSWASMSNSSTSGHEPGSGRCVPL
jgi:hypothetical protein